MPSSNPEIQRSSHQTQSHLPLLRFPSCGRLEDGSQVVQFLFQPIEPQQLFGTQEVRLGLLHEFQVVVRVHSLCGFQFSLALETCQPELTERLKHDEPGFATFPLRLLYQVLVKQGRDALKH